MFIELQQQHTRDIVRPVIINFDLVVSIVSSYEGKTLLRMATIHDDHIEVLETVGEVLEKIGGWGK